VLGKEETLHILKNGKTLVDVSVGLDLGDFNPSDIEDALSVTKPILRIDSPISSDDDREWIETIAAPETKNFSRMDLDILRNVLKNLLTVLDEKQATVIACRYCLDGVEKASYEELGKRFGLTRERTRQIEKEALEMLRSCQDSSQLFAFLG
jgi:RNA polymerase sigma factor (sigma-70 family)